MAPQSFVWTLRIIPWVLSQKVGTSGESSERVTIVASNEMSRWAHGTPDRDVPFANIVKYCATIVFRIGFAPASSVALAPGKPRPTWARWVMQFSK
jgi:hypothetical protein